MFIVDLSEYAEAQPGDAIRPREPGPVIEYCLRVYVVVLQERSATNRK